MSQVATAILKQDKDFRFAITFSEGMPVVYGDEPPPPGNASGPSPSQLPAAAVGNCLSDSLRFALRKFKQNPEPIRTAVAATIDRTAENRLRVMNIAVKLTRGVPGERFAHLDRARGQFEEFCTVSQSVRQGVPVTVEVYDSGGRRPK